MDVGTIDRDKMVLENLGLIGSAMKKIGCRYHHDESAMEDIFQEGVIGLMTAIEKFDPERGVKFSTHAFWWILSAVQNAEKRLRKRVLLSIETPIGDGLTIGNCLEAKKEEERPECDEEVLARHIKQALTGKEKRLVKWLYYDGLTMVDIGRKVGKSKERIRQLKNVVLRKLRVAMSV